jgi:hypothetical protein
VSYFCGNGCGMMCSLLRPTIIASSSFLFLPKSKNFQLEPTITLKLIYFERKRLRISIVGLSMSLLFHYHL